MWSRSISKEINDIKVAFKLFEGGKNVPVGYTFFNCHMMFDVKMEDFHRKYRLVSGGRMTETPATMTYAIVV